MKISTMLATGLLGGGAKAAVVPTSIDFSALADGAIPGWDGATFRVASGRAVNNPTLDAELFDAPAAAFTTGTYHWAANPNDTIANVANELQVTYVNQALGASLYLRNSADLSADLVEGKWYLYSCGAYKLGTGNTSLQLQRLVLNDITNVPVSATSKATHKIAFYHGSYIISQLDVAGLAAGRVAYLDDQSLKNILPATLFAAPTATRFTGDLVVRARLTIDDTNALYSQGVFCCLDNLTNPLNYVYAFIDPKANYKAHLFKVVNGTPTYSILAGGTYVSNAWLEIRRVGNVFQLWYNGAQVGADQTITDAGIINNKIHGLFNPGGEVGGATNFFLGKNITIRDLGFVGGSITAYESYVDYAYPAIQNVNSGYNINLRRAAVGGQTSWEGFFRLSAEILAYSPQVIVLDHAANNLNLPVYQYQLEGMIRRIRTLAPTAKIIMAIFGRFNDPATNNHVGVQPLVTAFMRLLASTYNLTLFDEDTYVANSSDPMTTWYVSPDGVHPATVGKVIFGNMVAAMITPAYMNGGQYSGSLPAYINALAANFEGAGITRNGPDNDGETGAGWLTDGTARYTGTPNDTIKWIGTFSSFGLDTPVGAGNGVVAWDVDGGGYTNIDLSARVGAHPFLTDDYLGSYASHTVTLKAISGLVEINRFLAI